MGLSDLLVPQTNREDQYMLFLLRQYRTHNSMGACRLINTLV